LVRFPDYVARLRARSGAATLTTVAQLDEQGGPYPLIKLTQAGGPHLLLTSGFHGEEPAGPLTIAEHLPEILAYARQRNVALTIYPCINPSGFEDGTRYNRSGEKPNNDFLRYELEGGVIKGELAPHEPFVRWQLAEGGPKETQALRADVANLPDFVAALDVHQDRWVQSAHVYAYVQPDRTDYLPLMRASSSILPPMPNARLDELYSTDAHGLTWGPDGSITDYAVRRGAKWAATLETTTISPITACHRVNLTWILGFIDLAAGEL
jgi:predicted deacylase